VSNTNPSLLDEVVSEDVGIVVNRMTTAGVNKTTATTVTRIVTAEGLVSLHEVLVGFTDWEIERNDDFDDVDTDGGEPNEIVNGIRSVSGVHVVVAQLL